MGKSKSSKEYDKARSMCDSKRKFKSNEASRYASKWGQRKYKCPYCKQWHLTKDVKREYFL